MEKIFKSKIWFLLGGVIFFAGGIRYLLNEDNVGAFIYLLSSLLFFISFWGQIKFNK